MHINKQIAAVVFLIVSVVFSTFAEMSKSITLPSPDKKRGLSVMQALDQRASANEFDTAKIKLQDMSDLLWAANGVNRPKEKKRTAPSALNAQDIDVYVCMENGIYLYDAFKNQLDIIAQGDHRALVAEMQTEIAHAPVFVLLVSDISRFPIGKDSQKLTWAAMDAGIVSQNISLFCASAGLSTKPRVAMDIEKLGVLLKLKSSMYLMMNSPVGYRKK